jgi:hypothetical protein
MRTVTIVTALTMLLAVCPSAGAQDPPPKIGPIAIDVRGSWVNMPGGAALAASRGMDEAELPAHGLGLESAVHVYPLKFHAVTFGLGGQLLLIRSTSSPDAPLRSATGQMTSVAPQLSLNFGTGDGWSYISGGYGVTRWSLRPDGAPAVAADEAWVSTVDYGAGARWFAKPHLAFHFDIRWRTISAGAPQATLPGAPRLNMFVLGAGISLK